MNAMDVIRKSMQSCERATIGLIEDMRDAPMTRATPGGNHPLWILGHLTLVEGRLRSMVLGEPNPVEHWARLFEPGSEPRSDAAAYPTFDEVLRAYRDLRARNVQILEELGEKGLDRPLKVVPGGMESMLRTAGDAFLTISIHQMAHRGQVADARRAAGRKPVFTPGKPKLVEV